MQSSESKGYRTGQPLPAQLRRRLEDLCRTDFSSVRVHVGGEAAALGAVAFATGDDLFFTPGAYAPESTLGRFLLGHELAHVMQQRQGRAENRGTLVLDDDALEREADRVGASIALDLPVAGLIPPAPAVWRSGAPAVVQCVKFKYLSERGQHYSTEELYLSIRRAALTSLETRLKAAIADYRAAMRRRPLPVPGGLNPPTAPDILNAITVAKTQVDKFKLWLERQDVVVDKDGNIDWAHSQENSQVGYDRALAAQGLTLVRFNGGHLFTDDAHTTPLDTTGMVTHFSGPGRAIYAMSKEGHLHVTSHKVGIRHHSSLLAGSNVAGAGEIEVKAGAIAWLSNKSGHYAPTIAHLLQVIHVLQKAKCTMNFRLSVFSTDPSLSADLQLPFKQNLPGGVSLFFKEFPVAQTFLDSFDQLDVADYELLKLLAYTDYLTDAILNTRGWRWRDPSIEKAGVYTLNGGLPVPHKTVRQWLKSTGKIAREDIQSGAGR